MSFRRRKKIDIEHQHRERWLISYADLMTLLLALFIVLYAASNKEQARIIAQSFAELNQGGGILPEHNSPKSDDEKFAKALMENSVLMQKAKIRQTERGLVISLSEAGFFAPGDAAISQEADETIKTIAESLQNNSSNIRVEGHTDSTPISNARYPSNWELSTARAASVLMRLADKGIAPERLSAAGYGGFQPVADNEIAEGRAQNRRVDVVILKR